LPLQPCAIVVAPEFDTQRFPTALYQQGGSTVELVAPLVEWARKAAAQPGMPYILIGHSAPRWVALTLFMLLWSWLAGTGMFDASLATSIGGPYGLTAFLTALALAAGAKLADSIVPLREVLPRYRRHFRIALYMLCGLGFLAYLGVPGATFLTDLGIVPGSAAIALYLIVCGRRGMRAAQVIAPSAAAFALVALAVLLAPLDPAEAQRYAATYSMLGTESISPMLAMTKAKSAVAAERYANARIAQTLGDRESAQTNYTQAYGVFTEMGYHYQAMLVASALAELTGEAIWTEHTREHLAHYPGCPLSSQAPESGLRNDPVLESLTPLQRQLARAHWSGMDLDSLSQRFSRSLYTIERHIADIYAAFGVTSSGGLRDQALSRGLA